MGALVVPEDVEDAVLFAPTDELLKAKHARVVRELGVAHNSVQLLDAEDAAIE